MFAKLIIQVFQNFMLNILSEGRKNKLSKAICNNFFDQRSQKSGIRLGHENKQSKS